MTGPGHYQEAERLLDSCRLYVDGESEIYPERENGVDTCGNALAAAQVHATLALAAATALGLGRADDHGMLADDANAWQNAAGVEGE